jgi:PST family polysaccharide transporter
VIPDDSLARRSVAAAKWNYVGVTARVVLQFVVQIGFARLLGADTLGLFAIAYVGLGICGLLVERGYGAALVQRSDLTAEDVRFAFTRVLCTGILLSIVTYAVAPAVSSAMGEPRLVSIIRGLAVVPLLQALVVTPTALLRRDMAFKAIQFVQISSYVVGFFVVGLGMAVAGFGVASLIGAWVSLSLVAAIGSMIVKRHPYMPLWSSPNADLVRFGDRVLLANVVNWTIENVDNLLVGKLKGTTELGYYSLSYAFVRAPANHLVATLQSVVFSASSRSQEDRKALQRPYLALTAVLALTALPVFACVALSARPLVLFLFGEAWEPAFTLLTPLAIAMALHCVMAIGGPFLWGIGAAGDELRAQTWVAVLLILGLVVAGRYSTEAMAWTVAVVYLVRLIAMTAAVLYRLAIPPGDFLRALKGGLLSAVTVSIVIVFAGHLHSAASPIVQLTSNVACAGIAMTTVVCIFPRVVLGQELRDLLPRLFSSPPRLVRWLSR